MLESRSRRGFTLAEIVVTLSLAAIVLGLVSSIGIRLQRRLLAESDRVVAQDQLASAAEVLPIDLRALSPAGGDIAPGEARDSSIQIRGIITNAIVCGGSLSTLTLATYLAAGGRSSVPTVQDGDTAWVLSTTDTSDVWLPVRLRGVRRATTGCSLADANASKVFDVAHLWAADLRDSIRVVSRTVVRITRPLRFSFYRAGDSRWYLGLRSWNTASRQFNTIQPISGPFAPAGDRGTGLQYFDDLGNRVSSGSIDTHAIARVEGILSTDVSSGITAAPRESVVIVVALRNRK
jgi:prepilin-type N-terminal cleavage/methylation domain-containing protein